MFSPFVTRKPWAASVIGLLLSPTVGMLFLGKGKWAIAYVGMTLALLAAPFVLAHFDLCRFEPIHLSEVSSWALQIVGAGHCYFIAKRQTMHVPTWFSRWYSIILLAFVIPLACSFMFRTFFYEPFDIPGTSMEPTLNQGDYMFVDKQAYKSGKLPQRNDLVVFTVVIKNQPSSYVKRVVGLPGEMVGVEGDTIYINEKAIGSRYPEGYAEVLKPHQLNDEEYFVIGDNQGQSHDSRNGLGDVMLKNMIGKPVAVIWSSKTRKISITQFDISYLIRIFGGAAMHIAIYARVSTGRQAENVIYPSRIRLPRPSRLCGKSSAMPTALLGRHWLMAVYMRTSAD